VKSVEGCSGSPYAKQKAMPPCSGIHGNDLCREIASSRQHGGTRSSHIGLSAIEGDVSATARKSKLLIANHFYDVSFT
jgi:hypothetical protein